MKMKCAQTELITKRGYLYARTRILNRIQKIMIRPRFHKSKDGRFRYGWKSCHKHELAFKLRKLDRINVNYRR